MGNYEQLKQSVSAVIKTNGNQEITGSKLQNVLLTIISTVGANATFAGVATPATNPGTPDGPVFYIASESGTYTNFNAIELKDGLSILMWNGSWSSQQILSIDDVPTAGSDNLVKSGGIARMDTVGVKRVVEEKNTAIIIPYPFKAGKKYVLAYTGDITAAYTSNASSWGAKRVEEVTGIIGTNKSTVFIPIADADYMTFWSTTKDNFWSTTKDNEFTISVPTIETERIENNINNELSIKLNQYIHIGGYLNGTWNNPSNTTLVRSKELIPIIGAGIKRWFVENYTLAEGHTLFYTFITYDKDGKVVRNIPEDKTSSLYFNSDEVYIGFCIGEWDENKDDADLQHTLNLSESYKLGVEFISYNEVLESINEQFLPSTTVTINLKDGWGENDVHYYPFRKGKHYTLIFSKWQSSFWTLTSSTHDISKRVDNITDIAAGSRITFIPTEDADYCEGWSESVLTIQNETIKNDIDVIQGKLDLTDIINLYPTVDYLPKIATLKKKTPYGWNTKNTPYCFLWFSDIHGDVNNYNRINKWYNHYKNYIDDIINCGDTVEDNISGGGINRFDSMVAINNKVLTALGNHDVCANVVNYKGYDGTTTIPNIYNMFTKKLGIVELGIVQPANAEANGYNFYYKDYPDGAVTCKPLRVVVLDSCISPAAITESGTGNDTTAATAYVAAQLSWFKQVLADAKTKGYAVVACAHGIRPCTELSSNTAFTKYGVSELLFDNASYLTADFVAAVNTFKQGGGEFVCWLSGHVHEDHIAKVAAYPDQLVIAINTATSRSSGASDVNPYRTAYNTNSGITKTTDAFDMVEIDTYYKVIRLVAVGTNYDMFGRHKDMIAINYNTCSILM